MQADTLYNYMSSRNIFLFHKRIPNLHIPYMLYTVLHFKLSINCFKYIILDPIYPLLYMQDDTKHTPNELQVAKILVIPFCKWKKKKNLISTCRHCNFSSKSKTISDSCDWNQGVMTPKAHGLSPYSGESLHLKYKRELQSLWATHKVGTVNTNSFGFKTSHTPLILCALKVKNVPLELWVKPLFITHEHWFKFQQLHFGSSPLLMLLEKSAEDGPSVWVPATRVWRLGEGSSSWLQPGQSWLL